MVFLYRVSTMCPCRFLFKNSFPVHMWRNSEPFHRKFSSKGILLKQFIVSRERGILFTPSWGITHLNTIRICFYSSTTREDILKNVFSEENKTRVCNNLASVKAVPRVVPHVKDPREAAVLIPLCCVNNEPSLLFMVRSRSVPVHKGEVCFPGGMKDQSDPDLSHTALREAYEEVGLPMKSVEIWGPMPTLPSKQDGAIQVRPYIGFCGDIDTSRLTLNTSEVDNVFTRSISSLCDPVNVGSTQFKNGYTLPVFLGGHIRIWGMTAVLLHQVLTLLIPGVYNYKIKHIRPVSR